MKLSVQLFTLRDQCASDLEGTLLELSKMGLRHVELAGYAGRTAEEFRKLLDANGLSASGAHVGIDSLENDLDAILRGLEAVGAYHAIVPWIGKEAYADGWGVFAERMNKLGEKVKSAGFQLGYHNHAFEFVEENGRPGLDVFFEVADPKLVSAELDVYWALDGGQNPADYIRKLSERLPNVHLKDGDGQNPPTFASGGQGVVDWDSVLAACAEANVEYGVIELDICVRSALDMVRESVEFFTDKV